MSRRQFLKELQNGLPSPLYYLHAKDSFLVKEAVDLIGGLVPEERREFNVMVYDADSAAPVHAVLDVLNTPGFFGERRIVMMRNTQSLKKRDVKLLAGYAENPSPGSVFVMLSLKPPDRLLREAARVVSLEMSQQETRAWLMDLGRQRGVELTPDAVGLLMATAGNDIGALLGAAENAFLLGKSRIDADDVSGLLHGPASFSVFSLVDALAAGDKTRVFRIYASVRDSLDTHAVLGAVNWKYSELSKRSAGRREGYFADVFRCLAEADMKVKTSGGEYPLEDLFVRLLRI